MLGSRRVTFVFDRGGYSPKLFLRILAAGFDLLTCGDSQSLWADCFSLMTFAAMSTQRAKLGLTFNTQLKS